MSTSDIFEKRVILVSGKGGVGRTTLSAALAKVAAKNGRRVLLSEIGDPEEGNSPLAQLFGLKRFSERIIDLDRNLRACHLWAPHGHKIFLKESLPGGSLIAAALRSKALQAFMATAPSFLEMGWFNHLLHLYNQVDSHGRPEFELIIVDMPATGHTLALTGLPQILLKLITKGPIPAALREGQAIFNDPQRTACWVVTLPEQLPVSEALELIDGLHRTSVPVGGVLLNRFPRDPFLPAERAQLDQFLNGNGVLGRLDFDRMERSRQAQQRLQQATAVPVLTIADFEQEGADLPPVIAETLTQQLGITS